jgi:hypothetical protein
VSTKQLLLESLRSSCGSVHKPGNISALWTPSSRVWAAMQTCAGGVAALQPAAAAAGKQRAAAAGGRRASSGGKEAAASGTATRDTLVSRDTSVGSRAASMAAA